MSNVLGQKLPTPARSGSAWRIALAMAVTLAIGATVHASHSTQALTAPPQEYSDIQPKDRTDFLRLLDTATAIRFGRKKIVGATHPPRAERIDFSDWAESVEVAGEAMAPWLTMLANGQALGPWPRFDTVLRAEVLLPGRRRLFCLIYSSSEKPAANAELQQLLTAMNAELELLHRRARGIARTVAEVAQLPASCARVDCPAMPIARLRQELARFAKVGTLRLRRGSDVDAVQIDDDYITGLAGMPIDSLDLAAGELTDVGLRRLAALPLTSLVLRDGGDSLTANGFAALTALQLREVTLHACTGLTTAGMMVLAKLPHLAVLRLSQSNLGDDGAILAALPSFPALREFAIRSEAFTDARVPTLLHTKVRALTIVDAKVTAEGLAALAELPSLQSLQLVGVMLREHDVDHLAKLTAVRQLEIHNNEGSWEYFEVEGQRALRAALPACAINYDPNKAWFDYGRAFPSLID